MARLLVICGVPATGKSSYGQWLAANRGWVFLNHDYRGLQREWLNFENSWWEGIQNRDLGDFAQAIRAGDQDVVVEFGFPLNLLPLVGQLKAADVQLWWFQGDRYLARRIFIARNAEWAGTGAHPPIDVAAFVSTVGFQRAHWDEIRALFRRRLIDALPAGRQRPTLEAIHHTIFTSAGWAV